MSKNYCLEGVAPTLEIGKENARIVGNTGTELAVRDTGDTANANLVIAEPTIATHATTKQYVDNLVNGLSWKQYCRVCTASALPANTQTDPNTLTADANGDLNSVGIDGVTNLVVGDRVLVKEPAADTRNGLYEVSNLGSVGTPWVLVRTSDALAGADATSAATFCSEGTAGADLAFVNTTDATVFGDALTFVEFAGITPGVTSVSDAAIVPAFGASLIEAGPTGAVTLRPIQQTATISPSVAGGILSLNVRSASISSVELQDGSVTDTKIVDGAVRDDQRAALAGIVVRRATFDNTSGVVPLLGPEGTADLEFNTSYVVFKSMVCVTTPFTGGLSAAVAVVQKENDGNVTEVQGAAQSDLATADVYTCDECEVLPAIVADPWSFQVTVTPNGAAAGAGSAIVMSLKI